MALPITAKGLRLFLNDEQQRAWLEGESLPDNADRPESLEQGDSVTVH